LLPRYTSATEISLSWPPEWQIVRSTRSGFRGPLGLAIESADRCPGMKLWESLGSRPLFSSLRSLFESDRLASLRKTSMTIILWKSTSIDVFLYCFTAMSAHFLMSLGQTLFHRYLGHSRLGGRFFKNHLQFHHGHYSGDHVVSTHYLDNGDNNTLFFLSPVTLVVGLSYFS
jgi:hypothetical protein